MDETKLTGVTQINDIEFEYHNARCFKIPVPSIGSAVAIYYDVKALQECYEYMEKKQIKYLIVYILACHIESFMGHFYIRKIHKLGERVYLNLDGA